mgnify:CR=1 FL=1
MMRVIVDTNVAVVANQRYSHATPACAIACVERLTLIEREQTLVLDDQWFILHEYMRQLRSKGQPGVGDRFLRWVLTNRANPQRCEWVSISPKHPGKDDGDFAEVANIPELEHFDPADKKFVAVALIHPQHPPVINAVDTDWQDYREALEQLGVTVEFVCGELKLSR